MRWEAPAEAHPGTLGVAVTLILRPCRPLERKAAWSNAVARGEVPVAAVHPGPQWIPVMGEGGVDLRESFRLLAGKDWGWLAGKDHFILPRVDPGLPSIALAPTPSPGLILPCLGSHTGIWYPGSC